jgi:tRNA modification GTPase
MTENLTYLSGQNETIVAVSTPPGSGGIGIVRLSGPDAFNIGCQLFRLRIPGNSFNPQERRMYLGEIIEPQTGQVIDEVMWVHFKAPRSFTTQDMVEIQCHGGSFSTQRIVELALGQGARLAQPGEFSCRAVLGGRLELAQAEAICRLIESKTENESSAALRQLQGKSSSQISIVTEKVLQLAASIEVQIDFPDDAPRIPAWIAHRPYRAPLIPCGDGLGNTSNPKSISKARR